MSKPFECTPETVAATLAWMTRRCDAAVAAGGIARQDLVEAGREPPEGYRLDLYTQYFIPPGIVLL